MPTHSKADNAAHQRPQPPGIDRSQPANPQNFICDRRYLDEARNRQEAEMTTTAERAAFGARWERATEWPLMIAAVVSWPLMQYPS
jgi:hypothetical protein